MYGMRDMQCMKIDRNYIEASYMETVGQSEHITQTFLRLINVKYQHSPLAAANVQTTC